VFSLFGNVNESALAPGWTDEQIVVLLGDVKLDLTNRAPSEGAILRVFHLVGDVRMRVPAGTRVTTSGTTLLGDHRVEVEPGEGTAFEVRAWAIFGDIKVTSQGT
jgi:predicted membrane protein